METLNLYKDRKPYKVIIEIKGKQKEFKIPTELTVEESERMLEAEIRSNAQAKEEVADGAEGKQQIERYFDSIMEYIVILLEHYQPEITIEELKKTMTQEEIIKVFEFFKKQRFVHLLGLDSGSEDEGSKKKLKNQKSN